MFLLYLTHFPLASPHTLKCAHNRPHVTHFHRNGPCPNLGGALHLLSEFPTILGPSPPFRLVVVSHWGQGGGQLWMVWDWKNNVIASVSDAVSSCSYCETVCGSWESLWSERAGGQGLQWWIKSQEICAQLKSLRCSPGSEDQHVYEKVSKTCSGCDSGQEFY